MAKYTGRDGVVNVGAEAVAEVRNFELNEERNAIEAPAMGQNYVGHGITNPRYTGTVRCWHDPTDSTGQDALKSTDSVALTLFPQGVGSGLPSMAFTSVWITSIPRAVDAEEFGTIEFSFASDSALDETPQT